ELLATIAAHAVENVASYALAVNADEHGRALGDIAHDKGDMLVRVYNAAVGDGGPGAELGGKDGLRHTLDELLVLLAIGNELVDGDDREVVLLGELLELRQAGHFAVGPHDFAEDASRVETGELAESDRSLSLTGPDQHAAL